MRRAGGYATYWTAHNRLLLEDSRPLESASANRFRPGVHDVEVLEFEWGWDFIRLHFEGRARRRIRIKMKHDDPLLEQLVDIWGGIPRRSPGDLGAYKRSFLRAHLRVEIREVGDVELRVCADGSILALREGKRPRIFDSLGEADDWLREKGLTKVRPRVVDFL